MDQARAPGSGGESGGRVLLVHNPRSRRGRSAVEAVRIALRGAAQEALCSWAQIEELAALEREPLPSRAIAMGGDGTVNAVAAWILAASSAAPGGDAAASTRLGIVPAGTGNNLARALGIPLEPAHALEVALRGETVRRLDVIRYRALDGGAADLADTRYLIQSGQLGFPAEINAWFHVLRRSPWFRALAAPFGDLVYRALGLWGLFRRSRQDRRGDASGRFYLRASLPDETLEGEVLAAFIGNDSTLGGGFRPCPRAEVDDGLIDICLVRAGPRVPYFRLFRDILRGAHLGKPSVEYRQSLGPVEIRLGGPAPFLVDGDIWLRSSAFRLELLPGRLRVAVGP